MKNQNIKGLAPFSSTYTPNFPELLMKLNCSLAITTYQAGKVLFLSAKDEERLSLLPRTFKKAMGLALKDDRMAVATQSEVIVLQNSSKLAETYPKKKNTYDALFMPRASYYTGQVDIHDLHWGTEGLWAVNTSFSCLCLIDDTYSFVPKWKPPFVSTLASEDRCHMNGLAMKDGKPKYVTALGSGDSKQSWRNNIVKGGVVVDVESSEIVVNGLAMPHTPRIWDGELYCLLSADQKLIIIDPEKGDYDVVAEIPGFVRGMAKHGDFIFIATSKLRQNSSTFKHLAIAEKANEAGLVVLHLPTATVVAKLAFQMSVDEIYDVQVLPGMSRPNIVNTYGDLHHDGLIIPTDTYWKLTQT